jgi:chorismate dehydratase
MVRLGVVSYLNTAPILHALESGKVACDSRLEFERGEPSTINAQFRLGRVDIAPISSVELKEGDLVVPGLSISAFGAIRSVALFSQVPLEKLHGVKVGLTPASASAASLLKVLCWGFLKVRPEFVLMKSCEEVEAALMIGDRCLVEKSFERWPHVADLAGLWKELTGLPMTFALFAHRPRGEGLRKARRPEKELVDAARALVASRDWGSKHLEEVVDSVELPPRVGRAAALEYLRSIDYGLGPEHLRGLDRFFSLVRELGIASPPERLEEMDL